MGGTPGEPCAHARPQPPGNRRHAQTVRSVFQLGGKVKNLVVHLDREMRITGSQIPLAQLLAVQKRAVITQPRNVESGANQRTFNGKLAPDAFTFVPPKGADIIRE
jgi:hypothetical protein